VADSTWLILREQGAIVEEADDDGDGGLGTEDTFDEKVAEKVGLHLQDIDIGAGLDTICTMDNDYGHVKEIRQGESETDLPGSRKR
jgi:hypothetical protein